MFPSAGAAGSPVLSCLASGSLVLHIIKAMVFPIVMSGYESWTIKMAECQSINAFELWCWRRFLRVPWAGRRSNQSILKEKSTLNIHWKDWCWSWNSNTLATWWEELSPWKRPFCWKILKARGKGDNRGWEGWMASLIQWTWIWASSRRCEGQRSLACCSPWVAKSQTQLSDWTELNSYLI